IIPWLGQPWLLAGAVVLAGMAYGSFWAPALAQLSDVAEARGLDHAYGFALTNIAWAPGQAIGAAGGGALAGATADALPYLVLAACCALTLVAIRPRAAVA
ncbi:MAG: hypothetical protein H0V40_09400, partial [Actinobacteria bacterium]|nr:hypothetical protein [Actinomycetota bacterium]